MEPEEKMQVSDTTEVSKRGTEEFDRKTVISFAAACHQHLSQLVSVISLDCSFIRTTKECLEDFLNIEEFR